MSNQTMKPAKRKTTTLTLALITPLLLLFPIAPVLAQNVESIDVQQEVDKALGVTALPEPATVVHLQAPHAGPPPLTGQPYRQQPAVAQDDFRLGSGGGRR